MHRSKILLGIVALIPAALLVTSHSSLGAATGEECRLKPDGSAPPGLHWYYRVDRTNNRHCWYLHAQGMAVHGPVTATLGRDIRNDTADEDAPKTPLGPRAQQPAFGQSATNQQQRDFTSRWIDLPRSVDLNGPGLVAASNGYAPEQDVATGGEHLPAAWPNVSVVNGQAQPNSPPGANYFGSISLAGAAVLALLLISEAVLRFVRRSGWTLLHRLMRVVPHRPSDDSEIASERLWQSVNSRIAPAEPVFRPETEADELRRLLKRAGDGLKPPQSFAPSRSIQHHDRSGRGRGDSALQRLKSRSFSGMTWAPL